MTHYRKIILAALMVCFAAGVRADDYVTYLGAIDVDKPLGRIVADPVRSKVYGITGDGDVVFTDRTSMSVENVVSTGRVLRDIDLHHDNAHLSVLDNVTGDEWNQPPQVYIVDFDLETQTSGNIVSANAPLFQMAHGRENRIVGIATNQHVRAYQIDVTTGGQLSSTPAGYYGGPDWEGPNLFVTNSDGTRLYRTEVGTSAINLMVFDISTDTISAHSGRDAGSYASEPVFLNSTDTSLYVGDIRVDPDDVGRVLGVFPEHILAATGDDRLAFGTNWVYDPTWGNRLQDMPVAFNMMALGENERYLYAFDRDTQSLHVMSVIPEPSTLALLTMGAVGSLTCARRRRRAA